MYLPIPVKSSIKKDRKSKTFGFSVGRKNPEEYQ